MDFVKGDDGNEKATGVFDDGFEMRPVATRDEELYPAGRVDDILNTVARIRMVTPYFCRSSQIIEYVVLRGKAGYWYLLHGALDEPRIYNHALSGADVDQASVLVSFRPRSLLEFRQIDDIFGDARSH